MSILLKGFSLFLKTLTVLSHQKNRLARRQRWCLFGAAKCKQRGNTGYDKTSLLSGPRNDQKGQKTGISISIREIVARSAGLPAEIFLAFIVVCTPSCFPFFFLPLLPRAWN